MPRLPNKYTRWRKAKITWLDQNSHFHTETVKNVSQKLLDEVLPYAAKWYNWYLIDVTYIDRI